MVQCVLVLGLNVKAGVQHIVSPRVSKVGNVGFVPLALANQFIRSHVYC